MWTLLEQVAELQEKRRIVLKQYVGASIVFQFCVQQGIHVSWEWAQRSQAWRLPLVQNLLKKYQLYVAVVSGCRVNLRDPKTQKLMSKSWKVMTTHKRLSESLTLPCMCGKHYSHARCEGGLAGMTAYYTPEMAKRIVKVFEQELDSEHLQKELRGERGHLVDSFGEGLHCICDRLGMHGSDVRCGFCLTTPKETCREGVVGETETNGNEMAMVGRQLISEKDTKEIDRKIALLHAATGHGSVSHMLTALQKRGAKPQVLERVKRFRCAVCDESRRVNHKHVASLEPLPPKFATLCADGGHWINPSNCEEYEFLLLIDEGSRFRVGKIMKKGKHQTMSAPQFLDFLREGWIQYFGRPTTLRLDPSGAFRSHEVINFCDEQQIFLDVIPGEAHWKIGTVEQAIRGVKEVMTKLAEQNPDQPVEGLLAEAIRTFNHRELVRGFSPAQHVLGQAPDETGRFINALAGKEHEALVENPSEEFEKGVVLRAQAEQALSQWQAQQCVSRALQSRSQRTYHYHPGDLVYFWRKQVKNRLAGKNGMFLGPARILAVETKREADGQLRPGSSVWLVRGRRLIKCCPEQLRPATLREEVIEKVMADTSEAPPWTFPRVAAELGGNDYDDATHEVPDLEEWHTAQDVQQRVPPTHRHTRKRAVEAGPEPPRNQAPKRSSSADDADMELCAEAWWSQISEEQFSKAEGTHFWAEEASMVEIEVSLPESQRGLQAALNDFEGYFINQLKRKAVEVSEKKLSLADREKFKEAKMSEVRNFVAAKAFEALPRELQPTRDQAIGMRWLLTWKLKDDGTTKAKARAILKGFQDPQYEYRATTTPVMTRLTRQCLLQVAAQRRWAVMKGDVTGAFLQGRPYPGTLYCIPCEEILQAMGLKEGEIVKVNRGCYGLVDAPLEWYRTISEYLASLGLVKSWSDPCCWQWKPEGTLRGLIAGHVDDFLFTGDPKDTQWRSIEQQIREHFKWSDWEEGKFVQCGVTIEAQPDGSFHLSQPNYLDKISEVALNATRKRELQQPTTEREKSLLRTTLGGLSWYAQQVAPHISAEVGLLLSEISQSVVETVVRTNKLLEKARLQKDHKLVIHAFTPNDKLGLFAWVDAAGQNRRDGSSTQGIFIAMAPMRLLDGLLEKLSPMAWHASKIDRVVRSPGAAEAAAIVNGEDLLFHARYQLGEFLDPQPNVFDVDATVNRIPGTLISDSRNVYDKLMTEELSVKGAERRTDIEMLCLKSAQRNNDIQLRWVHSEAQLGNALTKEGAKELELLYKMNFLWRIVCDKDMMSAKKRKSQGLSVLQQKQQHTNKN